MYVVSVDFFICRELKKDNLSFHLSELKKNSLKHKLNGRLAVKLYLFVSAALSKEVNT